MSDPKASEPTQLDVKVDPPAKKVATDRGTFIRPPSSNPEADQLKNPKLPPLILGRRVQERRVKRDGPFVKYVALGTRREIHPHDWKQVVGDNVKNANAVHIWSQDNEFAIPTSEFTDHQLDYLLCDDLDQNGAHSFLEVDYDKDGNLVQLKQLHAQAAAEEAEEAS